MAEAIARREIEKMGWTQVEVRSAGVSAYDGFPASEGAVHVGGENGVDLSGHRSSALTPELVAWADLILVMSPTQYLHVVDMGGGERTALLTAFVAGEEGEEVEGPGVPDPFGGDHEAYRLTFRALEALVAKALRRLEPIVAP